MLEKFLTSNETKWRLARTIVQGLLGVLIAESDVLIGTFNIPADLKPVIVALVMAVLSPIMAEMRKADNDE